MSAKPSKQAGKSRRWYYAPDLLTSDFALRLVDEQSHAASAASR